jgi:hypothetical protein
VILVGADRTTVSDLARALRPEAFRLHYRSLGTGPLSGSLMVEPVALLVDSFCSGAGPDAIETTFGGLPTFWRGIRRAGLIGPGQEALVGSLLALGCDEVFERQANSPRLRRWLRQCARELESRRLAHPPP